MNKTINVNLSGRFFYVDEAAYALLNDYLEKLKITFQNTPGKEEILGDIKARIAELFETLKKQENQVIGKADVRIHYRNLRTARRLYYRGRYYRSTPIGLGAKVVSGSRRSLHWRCGCGFGTLF